MSVLIPIVLVALCVTLPFLMELQSRRRMLRQFAQRSERMKLALHLMTDHHVAVRHVPKEYDDVVRAHDREHKVFGHDLSDEYKELVSKRPANA